ncbi:PREDICTED: uncharacterized protein LOC105568266 [Vollenhovia emeryi]|uniref:uncharacterized protein LOC105568266 n=1 Tax=Vollenhovia emeryi TaxID=411798 RepID=UPI0005F3AA9B|nr:PREDICTED: uncharacterized protein LOC105568266 [Vollenhovia emeryi]XP_011879162.1 PREDICTED: uncharacterized protein LOC105568266 [Vollenhovia emeryi]
MSCQRGNASRSRPPKHQNRTSFKNDLHDKSKRTKQINSTEVANVCERCKKIIEWRIKYKKYKVLKAPMKCIRCEQKTVKHSYHNICLLCAKQQGVCSKCGQKKEIVEGKPSQAEQIKLDAEFREILKTMSERKRRTFLRYMDQQSTKSKKPSKSRTSEFSSDTDRIDSEDRSEDEAGLKKKEDLLMKLKSLAIEEDDDVDSDTNDEGESDNFDSDVDDLSCIETCSK